MKAHLPIFDATIREKHYSLTINVFKHKIPDLSLGERQDVPIEVLRE
jgi:hypothetical protein